LFDLVVSKPLEFPFNWLTRNPIYSPKIQLTHGGTSFDRRVIDCRPITLNNLGHSDELAAGHQEIIAIGGR